MSARLTLTQKQWREEARMCAESTRVAVLHASNPYRNHFRGTSKTVWHDRAYQWAKQSAHSVFMAHPELRS